MSTQTGTNRNMVYSEKGKHGQMKVRNRSLGTDIDKLAARGLNAGADLDIAVRETRLDLRQVAQLVPDRRVVLDARGFSLAGRTQQRGRGKEPRAER